MSEPYEVMFDTHFGFGGRSFPSKEEAERAAEEMRAAGVKVTSVHPAPSSPWPDAPAGTFARR